jgi:hypothetical protein
MAPPLFSIVIPTYNRAELVRPAIQSVLDQTFTDYEIVVSDNHSVDDTAQVVKSFKDARIRYVKPPQHMKPADHFEFVRLEAKGELVLLLGDDDALVGTMLEQFAHAARRFDADFLFCKVAEYRTGSFPGPFPNTMDCPSFSGGARIVERDEYLRSVFSFELKFTFHPTAYVFGRELADRVAARGGKFFRTNGIEAYAWPMSAAFAKRLVYIDAPLAIMGRTHKSFGSNVVLCNPGEERLDQMKTDYGTFFEYAPLRTMAFSNLQCDGILGAKHTAPEAFGDYEFDEVPYLRRTMSYLRHLEEVGVDVRGEITELLDYALKYPALHTELAREEPNSGASIALRARRFIGDLGARKVNARIRAFKQLQKLRQGQSESELRDISGAIFGFHDILGCAKFLTPFVSLQSESRAQRAG